MKRNWSRSPAEGWFNSIIGVVLLVAIWSGSIVLLGAACRLAAYLFCIGYRC